MYTKLCLDGFDQLQLVYEGPTTLEAFGIKWFDNEENGEKSTAIVQMQVHWFPAGAWVSSQVQS